MAKLRAVSFIPQNNAEKQTNYNRIIQQIKEDVVPTSGKSRFWLRSFRQVAAILIIILSVSVTTYYIIKDFTSNSDSSICFETVAPIGSQTKIILPDSTVVWLNAGSSLKYSQSFGKKKREVTLLGEGYFEVKKNLTKPFLVHCNELDVKVLGTVFNVRYYKEDKNVVVDLIEGVVNVSLPELKNAASLTIKSNERAVFNRQTRLLETFEVDAARSAMWTTGRLSFVDATLEQISKDLERKFGVNIQIKNDQIKNEVFSGSLNLNLSLNDILSTIDVDKKFNIDQVGDTLIINMK
jgi:ferric-dicitrate binding protein FerR (iron transport regulator)